MELYIYSREQDFLQSPHKIRDFSKIRKGFRTGLLCTMEDKITVWHDDKLNVYDSVLLWERTLFGKRLRKLNKFPVEVHVLEVKNKDEIIYKNASNIAWAILDNKKP